MNEETSLLLLNTIQKGTE
ncbi:hypothetical protein CIB84_014832 [Bambusicola thoracicus]|uniref:Uncharacterized protein n=1 Tax=Bambusicola thoracicus TaxID=9083 RepID=A0A2P4SBE2_BAMTH|nr:hypothetical protein CIB84_014832 [Bambusicola thoracicus]